MYNNTNININNYQNYNFNNYSSINNNYFINNIFNNSKYNYYNYPINNFNNNNINLPLFKENGNQNQKNIINMNGNFKYNNSDALMKDIEDYFLNNSKNNNCINKRFLNGEEKNYINSFKYKNMK